MERSVSSVGWLVQSLSDIPDDECWLSPCERSTLARLRFSKRRDDWRLGRWTAKRAIQESTPIYGSTDLSAIEIRAASDGAPEAFLNGHPALLSISLSHSHGLGFCVVGPRDISLGCDLELIEPRTLDFIEDYFTAEEIDSLKSMDADPKAVFATVIWSAKESALKVLREGLRRDTRDVVVRYDGEADSKGWNPWIASCTGSAHGFTGWWRHWNGYIQAVAADRKTAQPYEPAVSSHLSTVTSNVRSKKP
jgi:4'-phosphopantetheinyl transferase